MARVASYLTNALWGPISASRAVLGARIRSRRAVNNLFKVISDDNRNIRSRHLKWKRTQQWDPSEFLHWYQPEQASAAVKRARKPAAIESRRTILILGDWSCNEKLWKEFWEECWLRDVGRWSGDCWVWVRHRMESHPFIIENIIL